MYIAPEIQKTYDLSFKLNTQLGYGHVRRNVQNLSYVFNINNYGNQVFTLNTGVSIVMDETSILQLATNGPLAFSGTNTDNSVWTAQIRRLFLTDAPLQHWSLINNGTLPVTVRVTWAADSNVMPPSVVAAAVTSVNGVAPDSSGNVTIDTGVMTINEIPSVNGNFNTDEGIY